jgi:hypothetical protein
MTETPRDRKNRVRRWLERLRFFGDSAHPLGQLARRELPLATGLSEANVDWALTHAFEANASDEDIAALVSSVGQAQAAHVLLSANVFVGALRAIAVALASSAAVRVRPSSREPLTAALLHRADPEAFELVSELRPRPLEHVWAYGQDATISKLRNDLPRGVVLHGHGNGFGVTVVTAGSELTPAEYAAIALDIAVFDQRGCLSPRFVLLECDRSTGIGFANRLLAALTRVAEQLPLGSIDPLTTAATARHRELWRSLGDVYLGPAGMVTLDCDGNPWGTPPSGRTIHVRITRDAFADLAGQADAITAVGTRADPRLAAKILELCPRVRWSPFGWMQRPRLDGPVDRRPDPRGTVIEPGGPPTAPNPT